MKIKLSKKQWLLAGQKAGWVKTAQENADEMDMYDLVKKMKWTPEKAAAQIHGIRTNDSWKICERCKGHGTMDNPSLHSVSGPSIEEQAAEDSDFLENYMAGSHDVPCEECGGNGKRLVSEPIFTDDATRDLYEKDIKEWYDSEARDRAEKQMRARGVEF